MTMPDFDPEDWWHEYEPESISTDALIIIGIGLLLALPFLHFVAAWNALRDWWRR